MLESFPSHDRNDLVFCCGLVHFAMHNRKNRVEMKCVFLQIDLADKSSALITHSMPTNRQTDEKIVNTLKCAVQHIKLKHKYWT